jgi:hypothetical protein
MNWRTALLLIVSPLAWAADNWVVDTSDDIAIARDGGNSIKDESWSSEVTPRMRFSCAPGGEIIASIDWRRFISSFSTEVGFKVDGGKFTWLKWKVDGSEKVTISPSASDTQTLIDAIGAGNELLVEVTPYSEGPVTVTFELEGLAAALETLKASCL